MATITTRSDKGSPLTNSEVDSNFSNINTELSQKESASNKGVANGYASLDGSGKVPSTQLPSYVDDVVEGANLAALPATGETGKIYVTLDTNKTYRWSGSAYVEISASPGSTDAVTEGSTNLYFTNARARSAISASGSLSYNSSTGVLSYTQPTNVSTFTNDSGYITSSALSPYLTSATAASTYQTALVSGTSIKTVNGQSVLGSGNIQIDGGVTSFNTRTGAVTLSSGDVTGALGYTPYNSTNPSGYITGSSNITGTAAGITGYTLADVTGTATSVMTRNTSGDSAVGSRFHFTTCNADGGTFAIVGLNWGGAAGTYKNFEVYDYPNVRAVFKAYGETRNFEVYGALTVGGNTALHAGNYTSYSPTLTGTGASGTWAINVTGNAATATSATDSTKLPLTGGTLTGNVSFAQGANINFGTSTNEAGPWTISVIGSGGATPATKGTGRGRNLIIKAGDSDNGAGLAGGDMFVRGGSPVSPSVTYGDVRIADLGGQVYLRSGEIAIGSGNYTSYSPSLTGSGASGTWGISINGNSATTSQRNFGSDIAATGQGRFTGWYDGGSGNNALALEVGVSGGAGYVLSYNRGTSAYATLALAGLNIQLNTQGGTLTAGGNVILHAANYTSGYFKTINGSSITGTGDLTVSGVDSTKLPLTGGVINSGGSYPLELRTTQRYALRVWNSSASGAGWWLANDSNTLVFHADSVGDRASLTSSGTFNATNLTSGGNQVLHAGNYTSYSPSLTGSGASGTWGINITGNSTTVGGLAPAQFFNNMGGGHGANQDFNTVPGFGAYYLQQGTNSPTGTTNHQWYGFTLGLGNEYPQTSYASQLYWPRRAQNGDTYIYVRDREGGSWTGWTKTRAGVADSISGYNNPTTAATANTIVYRDSGGDIYGRYFFGVHFNQSSSNSENSSIAAFWTNNASDNYNRKSSPAHVISQLGLLTTSNYTSYAIPRSGSWLGDLASYGYTREHGIGMTGGSEFVVLSKAGQGYTLVDGSYLAYEAGGFYSSNNSAGNTLLGFQADTTSSVNFNCILKASTDIRAPRLYDSNDTSYYLDPAGSSQLNTVYIANDIRNNSSVSADDTFGIFWSDDRSGAYAIYKESGAWAHPFPDLRIAFHTGIKLGANASYQGIRFYTDYDMTSEVMSVNNGSSPIGAGHVYVNNVLQAGASLRAPVFYDSDNTAYFLDAASTGGALNIAGNIACVARSSSWAEGIRIDVPSAGTWGGIRFTRNNVSGPGNWAIGYTGLNSSDDLTWYGGTNNLIQLNLDQSGNLTARGNVTAYGSPSDRRLKENIQPLTGALNKIMRLQGCTFRWKEDSREYEIAELRDDVGFIADDVQEILPAMVRRGSDGYLSLRDRGFSAFLVEAVKEQQAQIAAMSAEINSLKERLQ